MTIKIIKGKTMKKIDNDRQAAFLKYNKSKDQIKSLKTNLNQLTLAAGTASERTLHRYNELIAKKEAQITAAGKAADDCYRHLEELNSVNPAKSAAEVQESNPYKGVRRSTLDANQKKKVIASIGMDGYLAMER